MSDITWTKVQSSEGDESLTVVFIDTGETHTIEKENHPNYSRIVEELDNKEFGYEDRVKNLISLAFSIQQKFRRLSDRITTDGHDVYFDGDSINGVIAEHIIRMIASENSDEVEADVPTASTWRALVNFLEKIYQNPVEASRDSLYNFIARYGLTIRNDGDFIAYKGLTPDLRSIHSGPGIVNDVYVNEQLDNTPGNIVEIPRSQVELNTRIPCASGLHAGAMEYASGFGSRIVAVAINPRDVVSVPTDCEYMKLRVARYEVLIEVEKSDRRATYGSASNYHWGPDTDENDERDQEFSQREEDLISLVEVAFNDEQVLDIEYRRLDSAVKTYRAVVTDVDYLEDGDFTVELVDSGGFRTFKNDGVISITIDGDRVWPGVDTDLEDSEEIEDDDEPISVEDAFASSYYPEYEDEEDDPDCDCSYCTYSDSEFEENNSESEEDDSESFADKVKELFEDYLTSSDDDKELWAFLVYYKKADGTLNDYIVVPHTIFSDRAVVDDLSSGHLKTFLFERVENIYKIPSAMVSVVTLEVK